MVYNKNFDVVALFKTACADLFVTITDEDVSEDSLSVTDKLLPALIITSINTNYSNMSHKSMVTAYEINCIVLISGIYDIKKDIHGAVVRDGDGNIVTENRTVAISPLKELEKKVNETISAVLNANYGSIIKDGIIPIRSTVANTVQQNQYGSGYKAIVTFECSVVNCY